MGAFWHKNNKNNDGLRMHKSNFPLLITSYLLTNASYWSRKRSFLSVSWALSDCPCTRAISPLLVAFYLLTDASWRSRKKVIPLSFICSMGLPMRKSNFTAIDCFLSADWCILEKQEKGYSSQFDEIFQTAHAQEQFRRYWLLSICWLMHPGEAGKRSFLSVSWALSDCVSTRAISPLLIAFYLLTDASWRSRKKVIPLSFMSSFYWSDFVLSELIVKFKNFSLTGKLLRVRHKIPACNFDIGDIWWWNRRTCLWQYEKGDSSQFHQLYRTAYAQEQFRRYWLLSISWLMHPGEAGKRSFLSVSWALSSGVTLFYLNKLSSSKIFLLQENF